MRCSRQIHNSCGITGPECTKCAARIQNTKQYEAELLSKYNIYSNKQQFCPGSIKELSKLRPLCGVTTFTCLLHNIAFSKLPTNNLSSSYSCTFSIVYTTAFALNSIFKNLTILGNSQFERQSWWVTFIAWDKLASFTTTFQTEIISIWAVNLQNDLIRPFAYIYVLPWHDHQCETLFQQRLNLISYFRALLVYNNMQ